uniref:Uncharacterized protein n=1 Tax=Sipha flava TaxID=143950 RepID=A0A2S2QQL0_9HEMI
MNASWHPRGTVSSCRATVSPGRSINASGPVRRPRSLKRCYPSPMQINTPPYGYRDSIRGVDKNEPDGSPSTPRCIVYSARHYVNNSTRLHNPARNINIHTNNIIHNYVVRVIKISLLLFGSVSSIATTVRCARNPVTRTDTREMKQLDYTFSVVTGFVIPGTRWVYRS